MADFHPIGALPPPEQEDGGLNNAFRGFTAAATSGLPPCRCPLNFYNPPVLDIKLIREKPDFVRQRLATRGAGDEAKIDGIASSSTSSGAKCWRKSKRSKPQRNRVSKEIGALMGQKKIAEAEAKKAETRELGDRIAALDKQAAEAEAARDALMLQLPNLPHESVKIGKTAEDNPVVRVHGEKAAFAFKPKSHVELCESLKLVDFARGDKTFRQRISALHQLGRAAGAGADSISARFAHHASTATRRFRRRSWSGRMPDGVGQFPKFKDQYYGVAEGEDDGEAGKTVSDPDRRDAGGQHSSRGNFAGKPVADLLLRLHAVFSRRGGRGGRRHARHDPRASI